MSTDTHILCCVCTVQLELKFSKGAGLVLGTTLSRGTVCIPAKSPFAIFRSVAAIRISCMYVWIMYWRHHQPRTSTLQQGAIVFCYFRGFSPILGLNRSHHLVQLVNFLRECRTLFIQMPEWRKLSSSSVFAVP